MAIGVLDVIWGDRESRGDMKRLSCMTILVAAAALAGCEQETIIAKGPYDPNANLTNSSGPIELPPSIAASKTYRCKDNSLVYIDWLSDGSARVKAARNEVGTPATAEELKGDAKSTSVTANGKVCHL